ncbi:DNA polymerase Y family protein [Streptomyces sp. NPDC055815]
MSESMIMHVRCRPDIEPEEYRTVLDVLADVTPLVQPLPPSALLAQIGGVLRLHDAEPDEIARRVRVRSLLHGIDVCIGIADTWSTAATASARTGPAGVLYLPDERAASAFLAPLPVDALYGVGAVQAATLRRYGLHTIGALAAMPEEVVCRVVGGKAGRTLRQRARGIDPRAVVPLRRPESASARHAFDRDMLDPVLIRAALLDLVAELAKELRGRGQIARGLTLSVRLADGSTVVRTRKLPAPSAHTEDLRTAVWRGWDALAFQRARVRSLTVTAEELTPAEEGPGTQLSLDPEREARLRIEPVLDQLNARWGHTVVRPAGAYRHAS